MPFFDGFELIAYAEKHENEEKLYFRWVVGYQSIMSFDEFKNQIGVMAKVKKDNRTAEEIFDYVLEILR